MGYELGKRLSDLKKQTDENLAARWRVKRSTFLCLLLIVLSRYVLLPLAETPSDVAALKESEKSEEEAETKDLWIEDTQSLVKSRIEWLSSSPLVLTPGASKTYENIARNLDQRFDLSNSSQSKTEQSDIFFSIADIPTWWNRMLVGFILRVSFVLLAFSPLWIVGFIAGYFLMKFNNQKKINHTILGVCDRNLGPYYSGIYGPYRPNNSFSGTEMSCPGLACPKMVDKPVAERHALASLMKNHNALSETNLELLRIVLAHADYPHFVEEENPIQGELVDDPNDLVNLASKTGYVSNEKGTLLAGTSAGLPCILEAHSLALKYIENLNKNKVDLIELEKNYPAHLASLQKSCSSLPKLSQELIFSLTPARLWAIAQLPSTVVAASYLSIEAGKSLVYKRSGASFTITSLYPNLQARAVIQSVIPFHHEHNGDTRLIVRQALISARRHGDFGRSFLPIRMPLESRALRDWLETMYAEKEKREEISNLVELDGHMEEIHNNFRTSFAQRVKTSYREEPGQRQHKLWKGLIFKSVVLLPLDEVVRTAITGFHQSRLDRIAELLNITRKFQTKVSSSARLPGFKRQAMEADKSGEEVDLIVQKIKALPNGKTIHENWRIVRRMLTRYNWLSTRIGDDAVPLVGVIHGILKQKQTDNTHKYLFMDALVPLRIRRFSEILGRAWENTFYKFTPYQEDIEAYTATAEYEKELKTFKAEPAPEEILTTEKTVLSA